VSDLAALRFDLGWQAAGRARCRVNRLSAHGGLAGSLAAKPLLQHKVSSPSLLQMAKEAMLGRSTVVAKKPLPTGVALAAASAQPAAQPVSVSAPAAQISSSISISTAPPAALCSPPRLRSPSQG
jgi:hypothetical protein